MEELANEALNKAQKVVDEAEVYSMLYFPQQMIFRYQLLKYH